MRPLTHALCALTLLALPAAAPAAPAVPAAAPTLYAGYQEVVGEKTVPVIGALKTRNRVWFLAEHRPQPNGDVTLVQRTCQVAFDRVMGVQVSLGPGLLAALPPVTIPLTRQPDGSLGGGWTHGWGREDLERDGHPGATIVVDAPMCGGRLYVASQTTTKARVRPNRGGLDGRLIVSVDQQVLGADSACLRAASEDEHLDQTGWLRLVPVPAGSDCRTFSRAAWPAAPGR